MDAVAVGAVMSDKAVPIDIAARRRRDAERSLEQIESLFDIAAELALERGMERSEFVRRAGAWYDLHRKRSP